MFLFIPILFLICCIIGDDGLPILDEDIELLDFGSVYLF